MPAMFQMKLGYTLMMAGELAQGVALLDEARQIASVSSPALHAKTTHLLGEALLKSGDGRGFSFWRARNDDPGAGGTGSYLAVGVPLWSGERDLRGKRVLVTHQLGFGDQFLLGACLADFQSAGATLMLTTDLQIHAMKASLPDVTVICAKRPIAMAQALPDDINAEVAAFAPDFQTSLLCVCAPLLACGKRGHIGSDRTCARPPTSRRSPQNGRDSYARGIGAKSSLVCSGTACSVMSLNSGARCVAGPRAAASRSNGSIGSSSIRLWLSACSS